MLKLIKRLLLLFAPNKALFTYGQALRPIIRTGAQIGAIPLKGCYYYNLNDYISLTPKMCLFYLFEDKSGRLYFQVKAPETQKGAAPDGSIVYIKRVRFKQKKQVFKKI
tara:strand:+ start:782 stop:1108 length:327 start_codon:yes stop_codon:yes gene_type:complete